MNATRGDPWAELEKQYYALFVKGSNGSGIELCDSLGWLPMVTLLLEELAKLGNVKINLIKEKWGCLRIQCHTVQSDTASALIDFVMELSAKTCSTCGKAGEIRDLSGWQVTLCSDCMAKK